MSGVEVSSSSSSCVGADDSSTSSLKAGGFSVHEFSDKLCDTLVYYHILRMKDSLLIWIGSQPAVMSSLSMAIPTPYSSVPLAIECLPNSDTENLSKSLSQRLAKKLGKQVYMSYNLTLDSALLSMTEKRLFQEINSQPQHFT